MISENFLLFILVSLAAILCVYSAEVVYQRCLDPLLQQSDDDLSQIYLENTCEACEIEEPLQVPSNSSKHSAEVDPLHVAIHITSPNPPPELFSVASGLLEHGMNVTVFYVGFPAPLIPVDYGDTLRRRILSGVHCSHLGNSSANLDIISVNVAPGIGETCLRTGSKSHFNPNPFQYCFVAVAASQYRTILGHFLSKTNNQLPDAILSEFHAFGAVFFAEKHVVPIFIFSNDWSINDIPGYAQNKYQGWSSWRIFVFPNGFIQSLATSRFFVDLNTIRASAGIPYLFSVADFWNSVTGIFVLGGGRSPARPLSSVITSSNKPPSIPLTMPLLPSWVSCEVEKEEEGKKCLNSATVVVVPPVGMTAAQAREILRSLVLVKRSLDSQFEECEFGSTNCHEERIDLQVKWMVDADFSAYDYLLHGPIPDFVSKRNSTLLFDDLFLASMRNKEDQSSLLVLASCDGNARLASLLQIPVVCIPGPSSSTHFRKAVQDEIDTVDISNRIESKSLASRILLRLVQNQRSSWDSPNVRLVDDQGVSSLQHVLATIRVATQVVHTQKSLQKLTLPPSSKMIQEAFVSLLNTQGLENNLPFDEPSRPLYVQMIVCCAWFVLILASAYLLIRKNVHSLALRLRITKVFRNYLNGPLISRLSELDEAWEALLSWWKLTDTKPQPQTSQPKAAQEKRRHDKSKPQHSGGAATSTQARKRHGKHR